MDLLIAGFEGVGLALAAGAFAGAGGRRGAVGSLLLATAVVGGAALFGLALATEGRPAWPGWPVGGALAAFAFLVIRDLAAGAAARAEGGGLTAALIAAVALIAAALSILFGLFGLIVLAALLWLYAGRRSRAARKYEGLRTLR